MAEAVRTGGQAQSRQVAGALRQRLLRKPNPEDPARCDLHRFILSKTARFLCPERRAGWTQKAAALRRRYLKDVYFKGHPLSLLDEAPRVEWQGVIETGRGYRIRKLRYEGFPGMWIPALLYEPVDAKGRIPGVLNPNGHHAGGKAMDYKQARCINLAKRGMLALNTEFIGMGELMMNREHNRIAHLDLCGVSGVAVFYLAMKRGLDVLLSHPKCDADRVAMTGLSGGGWQTAVLSALDERVRVIVPVAGHSPVWQRVSCTADIGDLEQCPADFCTVADYDTLTALFAPRPTLLIYNLRDDCCFRSRRTRLSVYRPVRPLYVLLGVPDHLGFYENRDPGTHNYEADNRRQLYRFLNRHFGLDTPEADLPYEDELLSASQLEVGLPEENETLLSLAAKASRGLPGERAPAAAGSPRRAWTRRARRRLEGAIRLPRFEVRDEIVRESGPVTQHRMHLGETWALPMTEIAGAGETQIVLADGGRRSMPALAEAHIGQGRRVVAVDVYGTGEIPFPANLQMTLSASGERPLGVLVGQILALMDWAGGGKKVRLSAVGPVTAFAALCAAALAPERLSHLYLDGMYNSLKRLIDLPVSYDSAVPLFCFGLLREVDVPELLAMTEGLQIDWLNHGPVQPVVGRG